MSDAVAGEQKTADENLPLDFAEAGWYAFEDSTCSRGEKQMFFGVSTRGLL